ncbi:MAG: DUF86 domain-containing protein [Proteobacteria bacterium]|nr:DUF86 domain-containing protein [Pseudomonadota bacterium]MBI3496798.1 DUF86 domain-containing protein [Pseudomonadota bacterium]
MAKRQDAQLVQDIVEAIGRIGRYTGGLSYQRFLEDTMVQDAVVRNLEIVGEAAKGFSPDFRKKHRAIRWQDVAGMRDRLIHHYAGVNWEIVWDVIQAKLPELSSQLRALAEHGKK